tara:strand:- start:578 stop:982 length:405 start_codon:yes stop_codon:yes gene_type:complete
MIEQDKDDCRASGYGENFLQAILDYVFISQFVFSLEDKSGGIIGSFGIFPDEELEGVGTMWGFSTSNFFSIKSPRGASEILSNTKRVLDFFNSIFPVVKASCLMENKEARRRFNFGGFRMYDRTEDRALYMRTV